MSETTRDKNTGRRPDLGLLAGLYVIELGLVLAAMSSFKGAGRQWAEFLTSGAGRILGLALLFVGFGAWIVIRRWQRSRTSGSSLPFIFTCAMNLFTVLAGFCLVEMGIRGIAEHRHGGLYVRGVRLQPYDWNELAQRNLEMLRETGYPGTYLIEDPELGWQPGPDRASADGMYFSSREGLRSGSIGVSFREDPQEWERVAVVGDSYTFGMDVRYEESWARLLENRLGPGHRVLNFGVDGYGVDQAYLRYRRDVRSWKPRLVLFGLIQHDLFRTSSVYPFLNFPSWSFPFAKPRYVATSQGVRQVVEQVPDPESIFSRQSIGELPYLDLERGYRPWEWTRSWYDVFWSFRYLRSRFRAWGSSGDQNSQEAMEALSVALLGRFLAEAEADGIEARIIYFPSAGAGDFEWNPGQGRDPSRGFAKELLEEAGIPFWDLSECLRSVPTDVRLVQGKTHYSPLANEAVAACLVDRVRDLSGTVDSAGARSGFGAGSYLAP